MVFNASKAYVRQLEKRGDYALLQPVYALAILDKAFDEETPEFYHHYRIVNDRNTNEVIKGLEFVMVELPKFRAEKWSDRRMAVLWLRFLKEVEEDLRVVPDELKENEDIRQALDICEEGAFTEAELALYDGYWDAVRVENTLISGGRREGRAEGLAEGEAIGRVEGLISVVMNCRRKGFPIEQIQEITGLNEERILEIFRSNSEE
jgi:predicted transposase/invertase (TIGR01784 family)